MGYFRNTLNNECVPCEIGTYSDTGNADSCTSCPDGETTSQEGSTNSSQCGNQLTIFIACTYELCT